MRSAAAQLPQYAQQLWSRTWAVVRSSCSQQSLLGPKTSAVPVGLHKAAVPVGLKTVNSGAWQDQVLWKLAPGVIERNDLCLVSGWLVFMLRFHSLDGRASLLSNCKAIGMPEAQAHVMSSDGLIEA